MEEQRDQPPASSMRTLLVPLSLAAVVIAGGLLIVGRQIASLEIGAQDDVLRQQVSDLEHELRSRDEELVRLKAAYAELWVRAAAAERMGRPGRTGLTIMGCDRESGSIASLKEIEHRTSVVERQTSEILDEIGRLRLISAAVVPDPAK